MIFALAGIALTILASIARNDPAINFLTRDRSELSTASLRPDWHQAEWIVFPAAVDARAHRFASLDTTFRREFVLNNVPRVARLSVRGMKRVEVKINGVSVEIGSNRDWKLITERNVVALLQAGANRIEARVFNHNGPPALWLSLTTDESTLPSDQTWETSFADSALRHAVLASAPKTPGPGSPIAGGERTVDALGKTWHIWIVFFAIAVSVILADLWLTRRAIAGQIGTNRQHSSRLALLIIVFGVLWIALAVNNTRLLPFHAGFDSKEHLNYIKYIQERRALPLPTEGWEMYQPPLYYILSAATLSVCRLSINDPMAVLVLRLLGAIFGIAQFILVFLSLRLLFPSRIAFIGLLLAAFLPMHLYLAQYVTNEILASCLATAAIYLCLRLFRSESPRLPQYAWIGLTIGGAMLTKATGILLLPVVVIALAIQQIVIRSTMGGWLRNFGVLLAACLAICGWHYARIWMKFGTPLLGNWDVTSGFAWWQEPGYHTAADYLRFGQSLTSPLFSGFAGFADGIYSTLWGDGLCGGIAGLTYAWNHQLLAAGYLWALIPTTLIVIGLVIAIVRFVRKPSSELFLLLGLCTIVALALIFMTLKIASYAQAKAFYGLSILTPLCVFGALGWEAVTRANKFLQIGIGTLMLVWAMNSFATNWIVPSVPQHLYAVQALRAQGKIEAAAEETGKAVEADKFSAMARRFHALDLSDRDRDDEAIKEAERAVELAPSDSAVRLQLAASVKRGQPERAIAEGRRAIELGPENAPAYELLMTCFLESHRAEEAIEVGREWLAVAPFGPDAHSGLSLALAEKGDLASAALHLGYVMMFRPDLAEAHARLRRLLLSLANAPNGLQQLRHVASEAPDSPRMLDELAWLLATDPDPGARDGREAVRLAERACLLTDRRIPALLATLAAAHAEAGTFSIAISTAEEALALARSSGDADSIALSEKVLGVVRDRLPYREEPIRD